MMKKVQWIEVAIVLEMVLRMMTDYNLLGTPELPKKKVKHSLVICKKCLKMINKVQKPQTHRLKKIFNKVKMLLQTQKARKGLKLVLKAVQIAYMLENYTSERQVKR